MVKTRTVKRDLKTNYKLYKFDTEKEMNETISEFDNYYKKSITKMFYGELKTSDMIFIDNLADDLAYKDLEIKVNDLFLLTRENISLKIVELNKSKKNKNKLEKMEQKKNKIEKRRWLKSEINLLFSSDLESVAQVLNRTSAAISAKRSEFLKQNPNFVFSSKTNELINNEIIDNSDSEDIKNNIDRDKIKKEEFNSASFNTFNGEINQLNDKCITIVEKDTKILYNKINILEEKINILEEKINILETKLFEFFNKNIEILSQINKSINLNEQINNESNKNLNISEFINNLEIKPKKITIDNELNVIIDF